MLLGVVDNLVVATWSNSIAFSTSSFEPLGGTSKTSCRVSAKAVRKISSIHCTCSSELDGNSDKCTNGNITNLISVDKSLSAELHI